MTTDLRQRLQTLITELPEDSLRQIETILSTFSPPPESVGVASPLRNRFHHLATQWKQETRGISSTTTLAMHPAYQQIIGMGQAVIPLLLQDLETKSGRWFWALKAITGEDPVPPEQQGRTQSMTQAWLAWGRVQGYQW